MRLLLEMAWYPLALASVVRGWLFELAYELLLVIFLGESAE